METSEVAGGSYTQRNADERLLQYHRYAPQFDRMCELVPVYQGNIDLLIERLPDFNLPADARICDLGAGTGNFVCALAEHLPHAHYVHLDCDSTMNAYAEYKYVQQKISSFKIVEEYIQRAVFEPEEFDLIVCVNALNTAPPQLPVLRKMRTWLKPGGSLFLVDFGREQRVFDWTWYMFKHTLVTHGMGRVMKALWENREAIRQNGRARADQKAGRMWLHTTEEIRELVDKSGLTVKHVQTCYREYSDLIVAQK